ncbi:hypothetical protein GCM10010965_27640 [Caldalkalibacillus thermarum]|nr:hypothetical protein [Caldalkalibacillus thermarum]GGK33260.1 hypothetical protein GCM10010965_27640 [Caldalkalibacillus thermarum]
MKNVEYLIGIGIVAAIALAAFIYTILPAAENLDESVPETYYSDYYEPNQ